MPHMTVAENIWLGREPMKYSGFVDHRQLARQTQTLLNKLNIRLSADRRWAILPLPPSKWWK